MRLTEKKTLACIVLLVLVAALLCACAPKQADETLPAATEAAKTENNTNEEGTIVVKQAPIATIEMENGGVIKLELDYNTAPNTVVNFIELANSGFYDGTIFHRVIKDFMIQGGDPDGTGAGGPGYRIKGEFTNNHVKNGISHKRGVISMARQGNPYVPESAYNTAGSQFFIVHADSTFLDKDYAAFGAVVEGMDLVDEIANTVTGANDKPTADQKIKSIRVETFGVDFGEAKKIYD